MSLNAAPLKIYVHRGEGGRPLQIMPGFIIVWGMVRNLGPPPNGTYDLSIYILLPRAADAQSPEAQIALISIAGG